MHCCRAACTSLHTCKQFVVCCIQSGCAPNPPLAHPPTRPPSAGRASTTAQAWRTAWRPTARTTSQAVRGRGRRASGLAAVLCCVPGTPKCKPAPDEVWYSLLETERTGAAHIGWLSSSCRFPRRPHGAGRGRCHGGWAAGPPAPLACPPPRQPALTTALVAAQTRACIALIRACMRRIHAPTIRLARFRTMRFLIATCEIFFVHHTCFASTAPTRQGPAAQRQWPPPVPSVGRAAHRVGGRRRPGTLPPLAAAWGGRPWVRQSG